MKFTISLAKALNLITYDSNHYTSNLQSIYVHFYKVVNEHIPYLLSGYIENYLGKDNCGIQYCFPQFYNEHIMKKFKEPDKFFYHFLYNKLQLSDLSYLISYLKEIKLDYEVTEEQYKEIAVSFKNNLKEIAKRIVENNFKDKFIVR